MAVNWKTTYRTVGSFTFTAESAGLYRFHVIGKGGNGIPSGYTGAGGGTGGTGGYGGAGGGYAIHEVRLTAGEQCQIEIGSNAKTTLICKGSTVEATDGGGSYNAVGKASGGNISNVNGAEGSRGGTGGGGTSGDNLYRSGGAGGMGAKSVGQYQANGGKGGAGAYDSWPRSTPNPPHSKRSGVAGESPVNTDTQIGGAGGGGGAPAGLASGGANGTGATGGVVIEVINQAPVAPAWIDVPDLILGGKEAAVQWGAASDPDQNLSGYVLERLVDTGAWSELYRGGLRQFTDVITMGWQTVQYRVKAYDSEGAESGYVSTAQKAVTNNRPPSATGALIVPDNIRGGSTITVSWGRATDADNNLKGYTFEQCVDGGEWAQIADTPDLTIEVPITFGWQTVQFRVRAYDTYGAVGEYTATGTLPVINNRTPTISGEDRDLGTMVNSFERQVFTVNDEDGDAVTVEIKLDGIVKSSFTATLGAENALEIAPEDWRKVANGPHMWTITATDAQGAAAVRTVTFTKNVTVIQFRLAEPLTADAMPEKFIMSLQGAAPEGSMLTIEACNNGYDESPAWEDVTNKVLTGQKHFFRNAAKTADRWGISVRVTLDRGAATGECYIHSHRGNYA